MINFFLLKIITAIAYFVIGFKDSITKGFYNWVVNSESSISNSGGSGSNRGNIAIL